MRKKDKTCPKCNGKDIVRIPGYISTHGAGNNILTGRMVFNAVVVTRYLCMRCGFSEEWVEAKEDREKIRKKYSVCPTKDISE